MTKVFVVDSTKQALAPCSQRRANQLLKMGKAAIWRLFPFTIILKHEVQNIQAPLLHLKIVPGSKKSGLAIVNQSNGEVIWAAELKHRSDEIKDALVRRAIVRRTRRKRKTRYREPRFDNRVRRNGWLPPSLESRVANIMTWVKRLNRYCAITALRQEFNGMDSSSTAIEAEPLRWQVYLQQFLQRQYNCYRKAHSTTKETGQQQENFTANTGVNGQVKVNFTGRQLYGYLKTMGLPVELTSAKKGKQDRLKRGTAKRIWLEAAYLGESTPKSLKLTKVRPLIIKAKGHGSRRRCLLGKSGFPVKHITPTNLSPPLRVGDIVRTVIPHSAPRASRRIVINFPTTSQLVVIHRADGYETYW